MKLYHYTCLHGWAGIRRTGKLLPNKQPWLIEPLIWLTDLEAVDRDRLGLTSEILTCDRTQIQVEVTCDYAIEWSVYANAVGVMAYMRNQLEAPPTDPSTWWVCTAPIELTERQLFRAGLNARAVRS